MKTLLLAAGGSQAYVDAGYRYPKNLAEVAGKPLVQHVMESLGGLAGDGRLVAVLAREETRAHRTDQVVRLLEPTATVVHVGTTRGAACSALMAYDQLPADEQLVVASGDALIDASLTDVIRGFDARGLDAGCVVFSAVHPRWSFVKVSDDLVVEAGEKNPISRWATAGFYWFRTAGSFLAATMRMIEKGAGVEGQYFVCPALNELILDGARIGVHVIDRSDYFSFRDPAEIATFENHLQAGAGAVR
ncbi:glycosyltransferase family 2 protein [Kineococcus sp. SYSU DK006]|uniref:glycosyltransferase family 2 protein n=1 Tax=Kineococcus sp. SYSU DK006 TaxID=3383127 RepID=UPI003D7CC3BE